MLSNIGNIFMMEHNLFRGEQKLSIFFIHFTSLVKTILTSLRKTKQYPSPLNSYPLSYPRKTLSQGCLAAILSLGRERVADTAA